MQQVRDQAVDGGAGEDGRLSDLCSECFALILQLRTAADLGAAHELRSRIAGLLEEVAKQGEQREIPAEEVRDAQYAVTAFIDETILNSLWASKREWAQRPLAAELFNDFAVGVGFFDKLDQIRAESKPKRDLLEVYYTCLTLGFQGKLGLPGNEGLLAPLIQSIAEELRRLRGKLREELSPKGKRPSEIAGRTRVPIWGIVLACGAAALIAVGVLEYLTRVQANELTNTLDKWLSSL